MARTVKFMNAKVRAKSNPIARFVLQKYYYVNMPTASGTAPQDAALLEMNVSTPFSPLSVISGTWTANDTTNEPNNIDATQYEGFAHCLVLGCHVQAKILDSIDHPASGAENLHEGVIRLTRHTAAGDIQASMDNATLRYASGSRAKSFQLAKTTVVGITKNASISNGYSCAKQWNVKDPLSVHSQLITNTAGSSNKPTNSTWMTLGIHCANDNVTAETLKPFKVQLKLSYVVAFMDPTTNINVPRPLNEKHKKIKQYKKQYDTPSQLGIGTAAAALLALGARPGLRRRMLR